MHTWQKKVNDRPVNYEITRVCDTRRATCKFFPMARHRCTRQLLSRGVTREWSENFDGGGEKKEKSNEMGREKKRERKKKRQTCVDTRNWLGHPRGNEWANTNETERKLAFGFETALSRLTNFRTRYPDLETRRVYDRNQLEHRLITCRRKISRNFRRFSLSPPSSIKKNRFLRKENVDGEVEVRRGKEERIML